jgi:hypothetical protein
MQKLAMTVCALFLTWLANPVLADDKNDRLEKFHTLLSSFNEVHFNAGPPATLRGAISSAAKGSFKATLDKTAGVIGYELKYEGLESDITQAHIHFGQRHTVGGIVIWLCQTTSNPAPAAVAASTPFCTGTRSGTILGTINASQVLAQTAQGIDAGQFDEIVRALSAGATYANVHTLGFGPGEIRGQIRRGDGRD